MAADRRELETRGLSLERATVLVHGAGRGAARPCVLRRMSQMTSAAVNVPALMPCWWLRMWLCTKLVAATTATAAAVVVVGNMGGAADV